MRDFDTKVTESVQSSIIDFLRRGEWLTLDWKNKLPIDTAMLRQVREKIDMNRVIELCTTKIEERVADQIINSMATEISTDVKSIMCNKELREDLRATLRSKIRESVSKVTK